MTRFNKYLLIFNFVLFSIFLGITYVNIESTKYLYFYILCISFLNLYYSRYIIYQYIFNFFIIIYELPLLYYFIKQVNITGYTDFNNMIYYSKVQVVHSLFIFSFYSFSVIHFKNVNERNQNNRLENLFKPNKLGYYFWLIICIIILVFGQTGSNVFEAEGYATGESDKSVLYEYFSVFYFLAFVYSLKRGFQLRILYFLSIIYCIKSLLFGGRIEVIQLIFLNFYLYIDLNNIKTNLWKITFFLFFGYYFNLIIGNIRNDPSSIIGFDYLKILNPLNYNEIKNIYYSNEGDVFYSSVRLIALIENNFLSIFQRFESFLGFITSIFLPTSWLPASASLLTFMKSDYESGGGGLISIYSYAWLSYLGPIFISYFVIKIFKKTTTSNSKYFYLYGLLVVSTFPRWFAYNPLILFKMCFWIIPFYLLSNHIFFTNAKK